MEALLTPTTSGSVYSWLVYVFNLFFAVLASGKCKISLHEEMTELFSQHLLSFSLLFTFNFLVGELHTRLLITRNTAIFARESLSVQKELANIAIENLTFSFLFPQMTTLLITYMNCRLRVAVNNQPKYEQKYWNYQYNDEIHPKNAETSNDDDSQ